MNKRSLPLLLFAVALVAGLIGLFFPTGDRSKQDAPIGVSVIEIEEESSGDAGDLEVVEVHGESRGAAPSVSSDPKIKLPAEIGEGEASVRAPRAKFTGRVVGPAGAPVADASVFVTRDWNGPQFMMSSEKEPSLTNADGVFEAEFVRGAELRVRVKAAGLAPLSQKVKRSDVKEGNDLGTFQLEQGVILRGMVFDFRGIPVPEAGVRLEPQEANPGMFFMPSSEEEVDVTTGPDGTFELLSVAAGPWVIIAQHDLHPSARLSGVSERPGFHPEQVRVLLPEGGSISGSVTGMLGDAECIVLARKTSFGDIMDPNFQRHARIDAKGSFEVHGLVMDSDYDLLVQEVHEPMGFGDALSESVTARAGQRGVVLQLKGASGLQFRVVNAETGEAIENFRAKAGGWWLTELVDADGHVVKHHPDGRARFEDVENFHGDEGVNLHIVAEGFADHEEKDLRLESGELLDLGEIALDPAPTLRVRVVADVTSEPIKDARVELTGFVPQTRAPGIFFSQDTGPEFPDPMTRASRSGRTDAGGWVSLTTIPGVECELSARHSKFAELELPPTIYNGGDVELRMLAGGTMRVLVLRADGAPAGDATVSHRASDRSMHNSSYSSRSTNSKGVVVFRHLPAGAHSFRVEEDRRGRSIMWDSGPMELHGGPRADDSWTTVEISEGSEEEMVLRVAPRGVLRGRITEGGQPLAGANLRLEPWVGDGENAEALRMQRRQMVFFGGDTGERSKTDGTYRLEGEKVGEYELVVSHPSRRMDETVRVTLNQGENELHVDLPLTIIEGVVVDQDGQPVAGAVVSIHRAGQASFRRGMAMIMGSHGGGAIMGHGGDRVSEDQTTDREGRFRLRGIAAGCELELEVSGGSYEPSQLDMKPLRRDEIRTGVRVVLSKGGDIEVMMLTADGSPAEFGSLVLMQLVDGEPEKEGRTTAVQEGVGTVQGLSPGKWLAKATIYDLSSLGSGGEGGTEEKEQVVDVKAGEVTQVLFQF